MRCAFLSVLSILAFSVACAKGPSEVAEAPLDVPSAEELYAEGVAKLQGGKFLWLFDSRDHSGAIDTFQEIIDNYPYSDYAVLAELKIADSYFEQDKYEESLSYYRDFAELHPQHPQVPYTLLRSSQCHYRRSRPANRDQTATRDALVFLDRLLTEYPHSAEAREGETLWLELRRRLGQHVMQIADFYMDREEYQSAADRYRSVLNDYPGLDLDAQALYKLGVCYTKMNLDDEAARIFQVILENYEGSDLASAAEDLIPAAN